MEVLHFIYPFISYGHLDCFHFLVIMNNASMNLPVRFFEGVYVFISLESIPRNLEVEIISGSLNVSFFFFFLNVS